MKKNKVYLKQDKANESLIDYKCIWKRKKIEIVQTPFLVKTKPKTGICFDSNNAIPHNTPQHVMYHHDLDVQSILVYWDTLMLHKQNSGFT